MAAKYCITPAVVIPNIQGATVVEAGLSYTLPKPSVATKFVAPVIVPRFPVRADVDE